MAKGTEIVFRLTKGQRRLIVGMHLLALFYVSWVTYLGVFVQGRRDLVDVFVLIVGWLSVIVFLVGLAWYQWHKTYFVADATQIRKFGRRGIKTGYWKDLDTVRPRSATLVFRDGTRISFRNLFPYRPNASDIERLVEIVGDTRLKDLYGKIRI